MKANAVRVIIYATILVSHSGRLPAEETVLLTGVRQSGARVAIGRFPSTAESLDIDVGGGLSDPIVDIRGFESFDRITEIVFYITPQIRSYSFLSRVPGLKRLLISHGSPDSVDFVQCLSDLQVLTLQMCRSWGNVEHLEWPVEPLDLYRLSALESLDFSLSNLSRFPRLRNVPPSLRYLNLLANNLHITAEDIPWIEELETVEHIFVFGNEVDEEVIAMFPNLTMNPNPKDIVPDYRRE